MDFKSSEDQVDRAVTYSSLPGSETSTSAFLTGMGLTLPVMIACQPLRRYVRPASHACGDCVDGGYGVRVYCVKGPHYACVCGDDAKDILKGSGVTAGTKLTDQATKH
jgi:hypothetical protein